MLARIRHARLKTHADSCLTVETVSKQCNLSTTEYEPSLSQAHASALKLRRELFRLVIEVFFLFDLLIFKLRHAVQKNHKYRKKSKKSYFTRENQAFTPTHTPERDVSHFSLVWYTTSHMLEGESSFARQPHNSDRGISFTNDVSSPV